MRCLLLSFFLCSWLTAGAFRITVLDEENGWPVPLVELKTTHGVSYYTDNAGVVAVDLPELMGRETWFSLRSDGYQVAADGFGMRGFRAIPEEGQSLVLKVKRTQLAKRLGRLTGAGLFAESQKLGERRELGESGVVGCDSVQTVVHQGKLFWAWGDTSLARYPLGLFHMTGAWTDLQPREKWVPPLQLPYRFFRDEKGAPRVICEMPGEGPTWLSGLASLSDATGNKRLVGAYWKIKNHLEVYRSGLCVWNAEREVFEPFQILWESTGGGERPLSPDGHPVFWTDEAGKKWILFGDPFPWMKCEATFEAWSDPAQWIELEAQKTVQARDSGAEIKVHRGSIAWNAYRQKWVAVFTQLGGEPSHLGEIWYAEAEKPTGPWGPAVKVVTHENYTFYNPRLHPEFTAADSPVLLFEGTYTSEFSAAKKATPRYNYNQILYRLDLNDPLLTGEK